MARKVFISFLGTNDYVETHYQYNDGTLSPSVRFIQEALISKCCTGWTTNDRIYIFYTNGQDGSFEKNWKDYGQPKNPNATGLETCLKNLHLQTPVEGFFIPEGFSIEEIWSIFDEVYSKLQLEDEIYFDVTHAFRSIPMFSMVLFNYAQFMLRAQIKAINYGAFEKLGPAFKVKEMPLEQRIAPIIDLMPLVELQQYTDMASSLITFGRLNKLSETLSENSLGEVPSAVKQIRKGIEDFDADILANRMGSIKGGTKILSIQNSVNAACKALQVPQPVKKVIKRLGDELKQEGFVSEDSYDNVEAAIRWAVKYKMLPQAYTLGQEYIISLVADRFSAYNPYQSGKPKDDIKNFRSFISSLCSIPDKDIENHNYKGDVSKYASTADQLLTTELISALRVPYATLGNYRNAVNHAKGNFTYTELSTEFNKAFESCLEICKQK